MLTMVEQALQRHRFRFARLDGSMSQIERARALSSMKSDEDTTVFLVSLRSGGLGLNLTFARMVFLLDPWWNPGVEEQAIDRVHRIGQTGPVSVVRFIIRDSVEERMLVIQQRKKMVAQGALGLTKEEQKLCRLEDLQTLFSSFS